MAGGAGRSDEPLAEARAMQEAAARVGFDWPDVTGVLAKLKEEMDEIQEACQSGNHDEVCAEVGDLLFSVVNLSRFLNVDPVEALRRANDKFNRRFSLVQEEFRGLGRSMKDCSLEELDVVWERVKLSGRA